MKITKFKLVLCLIVIAGIALILDSSIAVTEQNVLTIGTTDRITELSPANSYDYWTWHVLQQTSNALITIAPGTSTIVPSLAESWEITGTRYTFHLRRGVTFWDGAPFNCEAMKWSLERNLELNGPGGAVGLLNMIRSIWCSDSYTLNIRIDSPDATFLARLTDTVAPSLALSPFTTPENQFAKGHYAGTGPYKLVEYAPGDRIIYEAYDNYWGPQPKTEKVIEKFYSDAAALRAAVEAGEVDVGFRTFNPEDILDLKKEPDLNVITGESLSIRYLVFTVTYPPFNDDKVRQAIAYAVDRDAICDQVFLGLNKPLYSMVPPGLWSHIDAFPARDLGKAKELLGEAGYSTTHPLRITLWYTSRHYGSTEADVAQIIKGSLEQTEIIRVNTQVLEWGTYVERMGEGKLGFFLLGWYPDFIDPDNFLSPWLVESPEGLGTYLNRATSSYDRAVYSQFVKLLGDAKRTTDITERSALYEKAQRLLAASAVLIPLWQNNSSQVAIAQRNVQGIILDASMSFRNWLIYKGPAAAPPVAHFTAVPTSGPAPLTVQFLNLSTGDITSYLWRFGDGDTSTLRSPEHTYQNPGSYTVSLTVTGPGGSDMETKPDYIQVTAENRPPQAAFAYSPATPLVGQPVTFDASNSSDPDGHIVLYEWNFGDGTGKNYGMIVTHVFAEEGTYTVKLTVTDDDGASTSIEKEVKVLESGGGGGPA